MQGHQMSPTNLQRALIGLFSALPLSLLAPESATSADNGTYLRLGGGITRTMDTDFSDRNCASVSPPALFGCANGPDGRRIGARGDFGDGLLLEAGAGYAHDWWRAEATIGWRDGLDFSGQANFLRVPLGQQPVSGDVRSLSFMATGFLELAPLIPAIGQTGVRPYIGAAAGIAWNDTDKTTYSFPTLGTGAVTIAPGGDWSGFAYALIAGLGLPVTDALTLDLAYRYVDLGKVVTDRGTATIVRSQGTLALEIDRTEAELKAHELSVSLRYAF